jgi:hypothetical protein
MKNSMQKVTLIVTLSSFVLFSATISAQERLSPPAKVSENVGSTIVTIDYSQPSVKGREIWGGLVAYGKIWRTGANEATTFEVSTDVKVEGESLKAGKYGLFTVPNENEWVIIFNSVSDQWGAFNYDESKDVLRVKVKPEQVADNTEKMTFNISDDGVVSLKWEKLVVNFNVSGS